MEDRLRASPQIDVVINMVAVVEENEKGEQRVAEDNCDAHTIYHAQITYEPITDDSDELRAEAARKEGQGDGRSAEVIAVAVHVVA
jgi:hypothetical protein